MADRFPLLPDDQVIRVRKTTSPLPRCGPWSDSLPFARAIESAARAPLLAEIERLHGCAVFAENYAAEMRLLVERLTAELAEATQRAAIFESAATKALAERDAATKALALVQQHHATAWNRGHTAGIAATKNIADQALDAVKRDAWGNAQLTDALLAAEAERDAALVDAERYHFIVNACEVTYMGRSIESTEDLDAARKEPTHG